MNESVGSAIHLTPERVEIDAPRDTTKQRKPAESGFHIPAEYAFLKRAFESKGELGVADFYYQAFEGPNRERAVRDGNEFINFCSYDYLGMAGDPDVSAAAIKAVETYGTSVSASRLVSGERPFHRELEVAIADLMGAEEALVFVSGFVTNADAIGHLMGPDDLIIHDALIHASVREGVRLSGAAVESFPHGDLDALEKLLADQHNEARQILIVVEGIYSMDGDIPDLPRLVEMKRRYGALLMVDEAHSIGVLGAGGRGIGEHQQVATDDVDLWMGTLSKAFASCGGYLAGKRELITYLRHTAPAFVYSVGLAPPLAAAALTSIQLLRQQPERVAKLRLRTHLFHRLAKEKGLDLGNSHPDSAVAPLMMAEPRQVTWLGRFLLERKILVIPLGFPAVPWNKPRFRFFVTANHSEDDIRQAIEIVGEGLAEAKRRDPRS